jgi:hypothetical protein
VDEVRLLLASPTPGELLGERLPVAYALLLIRALQEGHRLRVADLRGSSDPDDLVQDGPGEPTPAALEAHAAASATLDALHGTAGKPEAAEHPAAPMKLPPGGRPDPARFSSLSDAELRKRLDEHRQRRERRRKASGARTE